MRILFLLSLTWISTSGPVAAAEPLALRDGDRVVLIGGTLIEREQRYGFWETVLTLRHPDKNVTFRNLGWSGDTVWGEARAGFDTPREGFKRLVEQTLTLKPTVIVIGYGTNEAFAGEAGLPRFKEGLAALIDALVPAKARIVLLAPRLQDKLGEPLPDPSAYNTNLLRYRDVMGETARKRGLVCVELDQLLNHAILADMPAYGLSDNGIHLNEYGYWFTSLAWTAGIPWDHLRAAILLNGAKKPRRFTLPILPLLSPSYRNRSLAPEVRALGLQQGKYTLLIDGKPTITADANEWRAGKLVLTGPDLDQTEKLRAAIIEKNRLFFHRYRPQNETYLFGFRKHEQGKNATEVAEFDALVARAEAEIAKLRVPVARTYELVPERKEKP